ncbi:MAG: acyl-CoA thioesterase [Halorientalis sp.]
MPYTTVETVRLEDTTSADTMFYLTVPTFLHRAVEDLLAEVGYPYAENFADDLGLLVANLEVEYLAPVDLGTTVEIAVTPTVDGSTIAFAAVGTVEDEVVFRAEETRVAAELSSKDPHPVPEGLAEGLAAYGE